MESQENITKLHNITGDNKPLIYIADLTYDTTVYAQEYFPIGVGYIVAYAEKNLPNMFNFKMFKFPNDIFNAIDIKPPDILALSYFAWNKNLSRMVVEYYLKQKPDGLVVFGGCAFSSDPDQQAEFFKKNKNVDIFVMNDGEFGFYEILKLYLNHKGIKKKLLSETPIEGCIFFNWKIEKLVIGNSILRPKNLDDIPSPYLTGLLDPYFDDQLLTPIIQSTRGCPFTCGYCWAGDKCNSVVRSFSFERVTDELDYVAERRKDKENHLLVFADSNFGMYPQDNKIAIKISLLQTKYNFPHSFSVPCGKNNKEGVFKATRQIKNCMITVSVQSTDDNILYSVKRKPIRLQEYKEIVEKFQEAGVPVTTEIITGLPGETRETHLQTLKDLIDIGMDEIDPFTLMFLEGTDLYTPESQEKNQWDKRFRIIPRNFGIYRGKICLDFETVGVGSNTYTFEDYLYLRGFHGALKIIFDNVYFREFTKYLRLEGIDLFLFLLSFYETIKNLKEVAGNQFRSYLKEVREEIWDSKEELQKYYKKKENFQKLVTGEKGENLLAKYKVITAVENFSVWCDVIYNQSLKAISKDHKKQNYNQELGDIKKHVLAKANNTISEENMRGEPVLIDLKYDVLRWSKENYKKPLSNYKFQKPKKVKYEIKKENRNIIKEILSLQMSSKSSLWKAISTRYYIPSLFREGQIIENC